MWSYMVVFAVIYPGFEPFPTWLEGGVISGFVRSLGPLPEKWRGLTSTLEGLIPGMTNLERLTRIMISPQ